MVRTLKFTRVPFEREKKVKTVVKGMKMESGQVEDEQSFRSFEFLEAPRGLPCGCID